METLASPPAGRLQVSSPAFGGSYICDFACVEASVIVELDGSQHVEQFDYDARRDSFLRSRGFRVLRFWNNDVIARTEVVLETIFEALQRREMDGRFD